MCLTWYSIFSTFYTKQFQANNKNTDIKVWIIDALSWETAHSPESLGIYPQCNAFQCKYKMITIKANSRSDTQWTTPGLKTTFRTIFRWEGIEIVAPNAWTTIHWRMFAWPHREYSVNIAHGECIWELRHLFKSLCSAFVLILYQAKKVE